MYFPGLCDDIILYIHIGLISGYHDHSKLQISVVTDRSLVQGLITTQYMVSYADMLIQNKASLVLSLRPTVVYLGGKGPNGPGPGIPPPPLSGSNIMPPTPPALQGESTH